MHIKHIALAGFMIGSLSGPALADPVITKCGRLLEAIVKTEIESFTTNSEIPPVNIRGANAVFRVPAGETRCVRVRFSAIANCPLSCFLRAFVDDQQLNPAWVANPLRFSTDDTNSGTAHSFEWVGRVGAGRHIARIQMQTGNESENANIGPYTTSVEILE
jgi:hypothetical protein